MRHLLLLACACHAPGAWSVGGAGSPAWSARIGGERDHEATSQAVLVERDGGSTVLWEAGAGHGITGYSITRFTASGSVAWTRGIEEPGCGRWTWADALTLDRDGAVIVAVSDNGLAARCLIRIERDGTTGWIRPLAGHGITTVATRQDGVIVAVAGSIDAADQLLAFSGRGELLWQRTLPVHVRALAVSDDAMGVLGGDSREQRLELLELGRDGTPGARTEIPGAGAANAPLLASDGHAFYVAWNDVSWASSLAVTTPHVIKVVAGRVAWTRRLADGELRRIAVAHGKVALLGVRGIDRVRPAYVQLVRPEDGEPERRPISLTGATVDSQLPSNGVAVTGIALGDDSIVVSGDGWKEVDLGAAGGIHTACWHHPMVVEADPPVTFDRESCAAAGWLARYPM